MQESATLDPDDLNRPDWNSLKANYDKHDVGEAYFKGRVEQMGLHVEHWGIDMRNHDDHLIFDNKMDLRLWEPLDGQDPPDDYPSNLDVVRTFVEETADDPGLVSAMRHSEEFTEAAIQKQFEEQEWRCRGLVDVKTKANPDWLGVTNLRHLSHYAHWANEYWDYDVPAAVYFTMVDMEDETVGTENILIPITHDWRWEDLVLHYDPDADLSLDWPERKDIARGSGIVERVFSAPDGNDVVKFKESAYENFDWFVSEVL